MEHSMYFFRNIETINKYNPNERIIREFEVTTDADIRGGFIFGPYSFKLWEFNPKKEGEERKLILKIEEHERYILADSENSLYKDTLSNPSDKAYYPGGDIVDEIIFLSSLFLRRRFKKGSLLRINNQPHLTSSAYNRILDKHLITGTSNLSNLESYFNLLEKLNKKYNQKYILSAKLYHQALLIIENEPDLAYLSLISSIEVLSNDYKIDTNFSDIENPKLKKAVEKIEDEDVRKEVETAILERENLITKKFIEFIYDYTEESFWKYENRPKLGKVEKDNSKEYLKRIYRQRSETLHSGKLFPPNIFDPPSLGAEIDFSISTTVGERKWPSEKYIPNIHFFERLVQHVLINFLKKNQINNLLS
jgi:hypothetical protein